MYVLYWIDWSVCETLASLSLLCKAWDRLAKLGARLSKRVSLLMWTCATKKMLMKRQVCYPRETDCDRDRDHNYEQRAGVRPKMGQRQTAIRQ